MTSASFRSIGKYKVKHIRFKKIISAHRKTDVYPLYLKFFEKILFTYDSTHQDLQSEAVFGRGWRPAPRRAAHGGKMPSAFSP